MTKKKTETKTTNSLVKLKSKPLLKKGIKGKTLNCSRGLEKIKVKEDMNYNVFFRSTKNVKKSARTAGLNHFKQTAININV